jgi:hypothetical protein
MYRELTAYSAISLAIIAAVLLLALIATACGARYEDEGPAMTLSSGMDKKVSGDYLHDMGGVAYEGEAEAPMSNVVLDVHRMAVDANYDAEPDTSTGGVITEALAAAGIEDQVGDWILPKAYAQDHGIDEQYLVRTGECALEIESYADAEKKISSIAGLYGGIVSDSQSERYGDDRIEGWIRIRVPADKFFDAYEEILALGEVSSQSISTDDVSSQFLANHSKIKNLLAQQATLQKMLDEALAVQRSRGLGEGYSILLDTQERLFNVTEQLQAVEDRQSALADQITRSTITARLSEVKEIAEVVREDWTWGTGTTAGDAYKALLVRARASWQGFIWFIITCWTWVLPLAFWIFIGWLIWRRLVAPRLKARSAAPAKATVATGTPPDRGPDEPSGTDQPG